LVCFILQLKIFTLFRLPSKCPTEKLAGNQTKTIYLNPDILPKHVISLDCQTSLRTPWRKLKRSSRKNNKDPVQKKRKRSFRNSPSRSNTKITIPVTRVSFAAKIRDPSSGKKLSSRRSPRRKCPIKNLGSNQILYLLHTARFLEMRIMSMKHRCLACLLLSKEILKSRDLKIFTLTKLNNQTSCR
jgi:hypothetical protein